jgi:anti-sigma factor RsiW
MSGNVNDIINSGILDLYVAGALSPEEISDVERHIEREPEVASEVVRLRIRQTFRSSVMDITSA